MHILSRRGVLTGLLSLVAAPAIVRASSLDVLRGVPLLPDRVVIDDPWIDAPWRDVMAGTGYGIPPDRMRVALEIISRMQRNKLQQSMLLLRPLEEQTAVVQQPPLRDEDCSRILEYAQRQLGASKWALRDEV